MKLTDLLKTTMGRLRIIAFLEGVSFLVLLCIAMPLKYMGGLPDAVRITGSVHGLLFVLYVLLLLQVRAQYKWPFKKTLYAFIASFLPFGTFYADAKWFRHPGT
jgi:integral membrane protein